MPGGRGPGLEATWPNLHVYRQTFWACLPANNGSTWWPGLGRQQLPGEQIYMNRRRNGKGRGRGNRHLCRWHIHADKCWNDDILPEVHPYLPKFCLLGDA